MNVEVKKLTIELHITMLPIFGLLVIEFFVLKVLPCCKHINGYYSIQKGQ